MQTLFLGLSVTLLLTLGAGCGSNVVTGTGGGTQSTGTGTQSTGTGTSGGCPSTEPTGGSCAGLADGLTCTYGSSVRPECRTLWVCVAGKWEMPGNVCAMFTGCPATQPPTSMVCTNMNQVCTYADTICLCNACAAGPCKVPPVTWQCTAPPSTLGCPPVVPNNGTACTTNELQCSYGFPCASSGAVVNCTNGVWVWDQMIACAQ
jgi:hypothetical protein